MEKAEEAYIYCMEKLYEAATPKTSYNELVSKATRNARGQLVVPYWKYTVEREKYLSIIEESVKKFKLKGIVQQQFKTTIHLGASPKMTE